MYTWCRDCEARLVDGKCPAGCEMPKKAQPKAGVFLLIVLAVLMFCGGWHLRTEYIKDQIRTHLFLRGGR